MTFRGIIHGKTIELEQAPKLADGQQVNVTVQPATAEGRVWGEGILASAGLFASDDPEEDDRILRQIQEDRKASGRELPE
jgi:hypothetical protein